MTTEASNQIEFQAEVQQLLDIVIHSLYTDKEIFVRELVSNAADALEKLQFLQHTEKDVFDDKLGLEIEISTDDSAGTITITDHGIGMTRDELMENLGTIAHSGSKTFLKALSETQQKESSLIGQFGVGFYSAFMVSDEVKVYTHSWREDGEHLCWSSDGKSGYGIEEAPGQRRGCKIVIKLRDEHKEFANKDRIKSILEHYSGFVPFAINLNGERVNTVEALWLKSKSDISDDDYKAFYQFTAKAMDEPRYRMHFTADAPLDVHALLFVPEENPERFQMGETEPGVALYCKKVLIDHSPKGLLPPWLRFLKGVIDSEDLPLNISRESMQDSALVQKLNRLITKRFLKFLEGEAKNKPDGYKEFFARFGRFVKEGVVSDVTHQKQLAGLLRFESSMTDPGELTSFADYLDRAKEEQKEIYFQIGAKREAIEAAPYLEAFKARGIEVLYLYESVDEYVFDSLREFDEKKLVAIDRSNIDLGEATQEPEGEALDKEVADGLCGWIKEKLGDRVKSVSTGTRLVGSPAMALTPEDGMSAQVRNMLKAMEQEVPTASVDLEINPRHPLVKRLADARDSSPELATEIVDQIFDNAMLGAGLLEDSREMVQRIYRIMEQALEK